MFKLSFQMSTNVQTKRTTVTQMQNAPTMMVDLLVNASLDSMVMERHAQVSNVLYYRKRFLTLIQILEKIA